MSAACVRIGMFLAAWSMASFAWGDDSIGLGDPGANRADEPLAEAFSLDRAAAFLDAASLAWQGQRECITCHTNMAYLFARPGGADAADAHRLVRAFVEHVATDVWTADGPRSDAEVVAAAAALAFNDARTTRKLHPATRAALDRMWTLQRDDGGWDWLLCGWPPMESDDHYGVTLAAIGAGVAPENYQASETAKAGIDGIRKYFRDNPPPTLHHQAMLLWASQSLADLIPVEQQRACVEALVALQRPDGGWAAASLGDWKRGDGKPQDTTTSDGYGTGFVVYVLRQAGVPSDSATIQRGIAWLKTNQRASGRWFTRSLNRDNMHFLTHAGTAMAVLALTAGDDARR